MGEQEQWRAQFDADVEFTNGGGLQAHGFRLDVPGPRIGDQEVAELFVRHLGLLLVGSVRISARTMIAEPHKGSPGVPRERPGRQVVDLSHPIEDGMTTYPGLPGPQIGDHLSRAASRERYAAGYEFQIGRISMVSNTGTYLDTPFHRYPDGADLATFPLARTVALDGLVVRLTGAAGRPITRTLLAPYEVGGRAVLLHTGWDRHWRTAAYGREHPFLAEDAAGWLAEQGAALVGIDSVNIDDTGDGRRPVHSLLLAAGVAVVEHLCRLDRLPPEGFTFHAARRPWSGWGRFRSAPTPSSGTTSGKRPRSGAAVAPASVDSLK
jgi:arylformamidase